MPDPTAASGRPLVRIAKWLSSPGVLVAEIALVLLMLVVSFDAFQRYLTTGAITGIPNLAGELLLVACVFLPLAASSRNNTHVRLGILYDKFPAPLRVGVDRLADLIATVLWGLVGWQMLQAAIDAIGVRSLTDNDIPVTWSHGVIAAGALLMCLVSLVLVLAGPAARSPEDVDAQGL